MLYMGVDWFKRIQTRRLQLGMSPIDLARAAKVSRPTVVGIESGDVQSSRYSTLEAIAGALGWSVADIFRDDDQVEATAGGPDKEQVAAMAKRAGVDPELLTQLIALLKALGPSEARRWVSLMEFDAGRMRKGKEPQENGEGTEGYEQARG